MSARGRRALGVAVGLLLDRTLGEPPDAWHPVAWFGTAMGRVEQRLYADSRAAGTGYAVVGAGLGAAAGASLAGLGRATGSVVAVALAVGVASAGRMLRGTAARIEHHLLEDDLEAARATLPWLVGRDPSGLDASGISAAVVESLAENTVDAVIAPACWGLVAGAPGVLLHRAVNTMDAMVGHRNRRYARFGWAAARLDDAMAWVPARIFAGLVALDAARTNQGQCTGCAGASPGQTRTNQGQCTGCAGAGTAEVARAQSPGPSTVLRIVRRDAPAHPSPNSGVAEAAVAGALGVELGGPLRYGQRREERPRLGDGHRPYPADITRARRLVDRVELTVVAGCVALWWLDRRPTRKDLR